MENNQSHQKHECIICKVNSEEIPLLNFEFKGKTYHICSRHIPVLIHEAHNLKKYLPGFEASEL